MAISYFKLAIKILLRRKFYTAVSVVCIAFTLMVLTFVTAVIQTSLHSQGVERNSDRYLVVDNLYMRRNVDGGQNFSIRTYPGYGFIRRYIMPMTTPEAIAWFTLGEEAVGYRNGARIESDIKRVNAAFWHVFEFNFVEGRSFTDEEDATGAPVAIINKRTRVRYFGNGNAIGQKLRLQHMTYEVIGVVENVGYPELLSAADIWVPVFATPATSFVHEETGNFAVVLLAKSAADLPVIEEEFAATAANFQPTIAMMNEGVAETRSNAELVARRLLRMVDLDDPQAEIPDIRWVLSALLAAGLAFMLLPVINLINLNVSRILERAGEIGVRKSFGAPTRSLIAQFVVENIVLTAIGGIVGFLLAWLAIHLLAHSGVFPVSFSKLNMDLRVFIVSLGIMLLFAMMSGLYPAWKMSRLDPVKALRGSVS